MVLPDGRVKLADFGIARAMDDPGLTATGGIMGSPGYMAPELFAGKAPSPASDLWALGATMFHAIEGRAPFQRDTTAATMHAIMYEEPVLQRTTGPLAATIMALLTHDDSGRLTAAGLRERLENRTKVVRSTTPSEQTVVIEPVTAFVAPNTPTRDDWADEKPRSRKKIGLFAGAAAVVVVIALAAVFVLKPETRHGEATAAQQGPASEQPSSTASSTPSSAPASSSTTQSSSTTPSSSPASKPVQTTRSSQAQPPPAQPKPPRETLVLTRYLKSGGFHFSGTSRVPAPAGFQAEANSLGKLLAKEEPGAMPLYACRVNGSEDHMTSVSSGCEGQTPLSATPVGYIFKSKPDDVSTLPLYRCLFKGTHFDSLDSKCEGYTQEWQFGWVVG